MRERLRAQGGIVLMCDGVQFDAHAPVLYLAWDALSGTPLFGGSSLLPTVTIEVFDVALTANDVVDPVARINGGSGIVPGIAGNLSTAPAFVAGPRDAFYL